MNFSEIDFASFSELLKSMKKEIEADLKQDPNLDDESRILLDSINVLIKELKGIESYDNLNMEKKKIVLPHLAFVFVFTRSLYDEEGFEEEDMEEWDFSDEEDSCEEEEEEEEEVSKPLSVKQQSCCGGHHHIHPQSKKPTKGTK